MCSYSHTLASKSKLNYNLGTDFKNSSLIVHKTFALLFDLTARRKTRSLHRFTPNIHAGIFIYIVLELIKIGVIGICIETLIIVSSQFIEPHDLVDWFQYTNTRISFHER